MDKDDLPKLQAWHYDDKSLHNSPEMQRQKPVSWGNVGNHMASDVRQHHTLRWYINVPYLLVAAFFGGIIGLIMLAVGLTAIITTLLAAPPSPHKRGEIIGWSVVFVIFAAALIFIF